jgi:hypothetical protein
MAQLSGAGSAVVRPVAYESGALTFTVSTWIGVIHAMMVEAARGEQAGVTSRPGDSRFPELEIVH